jgi:tripartite-type tricarboxylate transporter receptor subunit TctC
MSSLRKLYFAGALLAGALAAAPLVAETLERPADGFPQRPITIVVPYGAGGGSDQLSREMGRALEQAAGISTLIVNKPGGGGVAGIADFMAARPDGYTVLQHIDDAASLHAMGQVQQHPARDWIPINISQITFSQLYVNAEDDRFPDWDAVVEYAKANPGKLTVANVGGLGSMERIEMVRLERALGISFNTIAFDKPAERYGALVGRQVDLMLEQPGDVRSFIEAGQIRPVLTFLQERPEAFAEVPSMQDIGLDYEPILRFRGFFVHKNVPEERAQFLEAAFREAFNTDIFQDFNKRQFMDLIESYRDKEGATQLIEAAVEDYREEYKALGMLR